MAAGALAAGPAHADADADKLAFFESRVRPVLAEHCYGCHGPEKQKAGLRVDHIATLLSGGDSGPALAPGDVEASRLLRVISYADVNLQMPPKGKLPESAIADLRQWIADGAVWPDGPAPEGATAGKPVFDLAARRAAHWAWQPLRATAPPEVRDTAWPRCATDRHVLSKLEEKGLAPAPPADAAKLLRRAYFDLTGLPPSAEAVTAFLQDTQPGAYERVVDRLLASPHFGEQWARHWLDLTRFAETYGFEGDFTIAEAWRYRDYVIRALNADLPYDHFVREQIAGDLLATPRKDPKDGSNESVLATGFWFMYQAQHAPVDVRMDFAERVDNQIDVFSKTFLGMTVSCARCHDHKFDAISAADYYGLAGILRSSRQQYVELDPDGATARTGHRLAALHARGTELLAQRLSEQFAANAGGPDVRPAVEQHAVTAPATGAPLFEDFNDGYRGWFPGGAAFGGGPSGAGAWFPREGVPQLVPSGVAHSGMLGAALRGVLRSPTFRISDARAQILAAGREAQVRLVIEGYQMREFTNLLFESTVIEVNHGEEFRWLEMANLQKYIGCQAYFELADNGNGYIAVDAIAFGEAPQAPATDLSAPVEAVFEAWRRGEASAIALEALNASVRERLGSIAGPGTPFGDAFSEMNTLAAAPAPETPAPQRALAFADGSGADEHVFIRGNPANLGPRVPRRFLEAIAGADQPPMGSGSGRLALAERVLDPANPLVARVLVNRVWQHLFGRGIVPTVDNFGVLGQPPSHPELLDHLAREFRADGWSIKRLIRRLVTSSAYRMDSAPLDARAEEADPANALLHRMPLRRLRAENVRDALLAVAGTLDPALGGPSIPAYVSPDNGGHRKPPVSGPLDGARRRSIYLEVRRNFLPALLQAFDFPAPDTTHGARNVSNVPAQALALMNDPFVAEQAQAWAARICSLPELGAEQRIAALYLGAFARAPRAEETAQALAFLRAQAETYQAAGAEALADPRAWSDLCHTLFMVKEFVFIG